MLNAFILTRRRPETLQAEHRTTRTIDTNAPFATIFAAFGTAMLRFGDMWLNRHLCFVRATADEVGDFYDWIRGNIAMLETVGDLMTERPASVTKSTSVDEAVLKLASEGVAELYVTDVEFRLLGVVTDYELLKSRLAGGSREDSVTSLMSRGVATLAPEADIQTAALLFRDGRYRQIAVVANGRLIGQILRRDVLRRLATNDRLDAPETATVGKHNPGVCVPETILRKPRYMRPQQVPGKMV